MTIKSLGTTALDSYNTLQESGVCILHLKRGRDALKPLWNIYLLVNSGSHFLHYITVQDDFLLQIVVD